MKGNFDKLSDEELEKKKNELKEEVRKLRFTMAVAGSLPDTKRIREAKKDIARVFTVQQQRELQK